MWPPCAARRAAGWRPAHGRAPVPPRPRRLAAPHLAARRTVARTRPRRLRRSRRSRQTGRSSVTHDTHAACAEAARWRSVGDAAGKVASSRVFSCSKSVKMTAVWPAVRAAHDGAAAKAPRPKMTERHVVIPAAAAASPNV
eukprot:338043-Prymnesium_polylepis.2